MMDGSLKEDGKTPADFDYNVEVTKEVVRAGPCQGRLGRRRTRLPRLARERATARRKTATAPKASLSHDQLLTDPDEAERFVAETGVDALAVAIGTSHGAYKFTRKPDGEVLAMDRIEEIHRRLPNCHLVMHGSSSVPQELQDIINKYGGKLKQTWGVPVEEIQRGIKHGVRKINVDTDNRLAITGAIRKVLRRDAREVRPARLPEAGPRRDEESLRRPHDRLRPGRPGPQDQARLDREVRQLLRDGVSRTISRSSSARSRRLPHGNATGTIWFGRNWKWLLPVGCLLPFVAVGGCVTLVVVRRVRRLEGLGCL